MVTQVLNLIFGSKNDREIKALLPIVERINSLESGLTPLSKEALADKTQEFKKRLEAGATLDDILPEAFAVCREMSRRVLNMRHFDVQLIGGMILNRGRIAEMKTGEGKTLVATLPVYLNALEGKGAHLVTVNDYLAKRDAQWMAQLYHALGLSTGIIQHDASFMFDPTYEASDKRLQHLRPCSRPEAYRADITYGTNNEYGFDYLRDNLVVNDLRQCVQRELNFAIVDEVDSILIDEARTPLIISGPTDQTTDLYYRINAVIPQLKPEQDYTIEEKTKTASLTDDGNARVEKLLGVDNLYDPANMDLVHHVVKALQAYALYKRDVDYVVKDGEVIIVDEFTGRLMPGRRWSDGLHQAVEAKEGVKIANENQTLASVTFQNYFRMYKKLSGMTGTADTEAAEFAKIYNLDVNVVPTNRKMVRLDYADVVYRTEKEKFAAIVEEIRECHERGQPVLVGTISIEKSEKLAGLLSRNGIKHNVLNAKQHEREAEIVAQAGRKGAVTIATNMAGRGTDILLGGNPDFTYKQVLYREENMPDARKLSLYEEIRSDCEKNKQEVLALGGLHILGTERHESRRIDNQLRGRAGRQGDPGTSRFYLSLQDDLMRIFASERVSQMMLKLGMEEGVPIEHGMVTRAIANAQKKVEAHNFEIRKQLLEYDDVMNKQREVIYRHRRAVLSGENLTADLQDMMAGVVDSSLNIYCSAEQYPEEWDIKGLIEMMHSQFGIDITRGSQAGGESLRDMGRDALVEDLHAQVREAYARKEQELGPELMRFLEKTFMLQVIDHHWKDHLLGMDHLRDGIGLRGYGQKDPLIEYKREGFDLFAGMMERIKSDTLDRLFHVQAVRQTSEGETPTPPPAPPVISRPQPKLTLNRGDEPVAGPPPAHRADDKVGRNDPCPCGSGKKYKKCHGA
ncbi:MAG: preprotein translocase subunit SecA [Nitrospiraceae bacterium]|jgi:preprotein translocase subunit SecA|uniref:preprotein translocase subunit SecA n=1 Tax=Nitrospira cf. moscoviensis SBR1015 TaxID=96242 RepID=UPI000A0E7960|nr:preprotein translocase subunit SecA [Nitrospira cf. moscoviensis SBR1015]MBY0248547.1 preprotein translocase subunit SecA [Nitrospiraceae bacterium]OQW35625.1 MAG: preprotein translocase subunit SecA [Nitrospira sp. SG-bin2]